MSDFTTQISKRSTLLRTLGTIIALGLLVYLLSQQGWDEIMAAFQQIPLWRFVIAFGLMIVSRLSVSARWYALLRSSGTKISYWQSSRVTFAGLFSSNFLPTTIGGDVVRLAGGIQLKFDAAICMASLVVDRLVGLVGMAMAVPLSLPVILSATPSVPLSRIPLLLTSTGGWWRKTQQSILRIVHRLLEALGLWLRQPRSLLLALGISWLHMLCLFSIFHLLLSGMGEHISIWTVGGLYSLVYFLTLLPISINGYGLQEISMAVIFSKFGGVYPANSLTIAILFRTLMMLASLPGAVFLPSILDIKNEPNEDIQPKNTISSK